MDSVADKASLELEIERLTAELQKARETATLYRNELHRHDCAFGETGGLHCPLDRPCTSCVLRRTEKWLELARGLSIDLEKILLREGGVEGAYERRLAEALRERDSALSQLELQRGRANSFSDKVMALSDDNERLRNFLRDIRLNSAKSTMVHDLAYEALTGNYP